MRRLLRESRPELVLANGIKAQAVVGPAAAAVGVPVVWVKHDHSFDRYLTPVLARLARTVIATADDVAAASARDDVVTITPARPDAALTPTGGTRSVGATRRELGRPEHSPWR